MNFSDSEILKTGFECIKEKYTQYYLQYIYDKPLIMSRETAANMKKLGLILHKIILHLNKFYTNFKNLIPRPINEIQLLEAVSPFTRDIGTFRTDFVIDQNNYIKIVEINSGQPLNGYFLTGVFNDIALNQAVKLGIDGTKDLHTDFFSYLRKRIGDRKEIIVVYGAEKPAEILIYPEIFKRSGFECKLISVEEFDISIISSNEVFIIIELMFDEILSLPLPWIERIMQSVPLNPFNTYFNAGDKRFFYLMHRPEFIDEVLLSEEKAFLMKYLVPAYIPGSAQEIWEDAFRNKNKYILKHYGKGRGENVYAGITTFQNEWEGHFSPGKIDYMVLQPYIIQKIFDGIVGHAKRKDYVTGTLLFFDQQFFGPGLYRTHKNPVHSGTGDFRKMTSLVSASDGQYEGLNYI